EKEWLRRPYKRCIQDNVFLNWEEGTAEPPTSCAHRLALGSFVIPLFGFLTDRGQPKPLRARPSKVFTTRPYSTGPLGTERGEIVIPTQRPLLRLKKASPRLMVVRCEGKKGRGFYVCPECGAGFQKPQKKHDTSFGIECRTPLQS